MLDYLVEDGVLLLFKLPISNVSGGQPSQPRTNSRFLADFLVVWIGPNSLLSPICLGRDSIILDSLDPWVWDPV